MVSHPATAHARLNVVSHPATDPAQLNVVSHPATDLTQLNVLQLGYHNHDLTPVTLNEPNVTS